MKNRFSTIDSNNYPLRIGILVDQNQLPFFLARPLKLLHEQGLLEVVCIVKRPSPPKSHVPKVKKFMRAVNQKMYNIFSTHVSTPGFSKTVELFPDALVVNASISETKVKDEFSKETIASLYKLNLDFLIRGGFKILTGEILDVAKNGVLSFHHGDNLLNRGGPALYWEFSEGWENAGVVLQILSEELDGGDVVARGFSDITPWSYRRSVHRLNCVAESLIYNFFNGKKVGVSTDHWVSQIYDQRLYSEPGNFKATKHLIYFLSRIILKFFKKLFYVNRWSIFYGFGNPCFRKFTKINPTSGEFWADPFPIRYKGKRYIFFERLSFKNPIGKIGYLELGKDLGTATSGDVDIGINSHLSFPFVFQEQDQTYMIPETREEGAVCLYKAVQFPEKWEKVSTLLANISAVDTVLLKHDTLWYLFTSHGSICDDTRDLELQIYFSKTLTGGSWTRHPMSPVAIDVRKSRMAGGFFKADGVLYRPGQDGSLRYGRRVGLYRVDSLTPNNYQETFVRWIESAWLLRHERIHTFNKLDDFLVLDAAEDVLKWQA